MIEYATLTSVGNRSINEDSIGYAKKENKYCFVVCDGLGGHGLGDVASGLVRDVFLHMFDQCNEGDVFFENAFLAAQDILAVEQKQINASQKMKTTCVSMVIDEKNVVIAHVGDSRGYVFNKDRVLTRTVDHSIPQMLVLSGDIKESEIRHHPERSIVLKVMGVEWEKPEYEVKKPIKLSKCQAFLLCTDGFWELIEEVDMCSALKKASNPKMWLDLMEEKVKENGRGTDMDNYSAIAIWNVREGKRWFF